MASVRAVPEYKKKRRRRFFRFLRFRRNVALLPNLFTLGNAFFGFCSIVFSAQGDLVAAAYFILLGALMDMLDGRIARMLGVSSDLGLQLDSLCDAISFCLAPAFLMYTWELKYAGFLGFLSCSLFLVSGIFRLARFNITSGEQSVFFLGIPTTIAGCFLATMLINAQEIAFTPPQTLGLILIVTVLSYLMISTVPFPTFKHLKKRWAILATLFIGAFIISMGFIKVLMLIFLSYFLLAFMHLTKRIIKKSRLP